ncbi:MAG: NCS2 family permease, partial [Paraclostridium sp.]
TILEGNMQATSTRQNNSNNILERIFKLSENNTTIKTEVLAGITTFMTMAYILVVNPSILSDAGMDKGAVFTATALAACVGSIAMGLLANYPITLMPAMGLNAFFAYTVVLGMGYTWQFALCAVFIEGIIFIILSLTNIREKIIECVPNVLKHAVTAGIGLFIAFIGFKSAGIIEQGGAIVQLGNMKSPMVVLAIVGIVIAATLLVKNVKGTFLLAMVITTVVGVVAGLVEMPSSLISAAPSIKPVFLQAFSLEASQIFSLDMLMIVFTFLFVDLFDTVGFLIGIASQSGMLDKDGNLPRAKQALLADAIGTTAGAMFGTSTVTSSVESAAGIAEGGKTGLTSVVTGLMFIVALFFAPIFTSIPPQATSAVLIIVGSMMASSVLKINFDDYTDAIPAFLTFIIMPLAYSVADGIMFGIVSYTFLKLVSGKKSDAKVSLIILSIVFILKFALL